MLLQYKAENIPINLKSKEYAFVQRFLIVFCTWFLSGNSLIPVPLLSRRGRPLPPLFHHWTLPQSQSAQNDFAATLSRLKAIHQTLPQPLQYPGCFILVKSMSISKIISSPSNSVNKSDSTSLSPITPASIISWEKPYKVGCVLYFGDWLAQNFFHCGFKNCCVSYPWNFFESTIHSLLMEWSLYILWQLHISNNYWVIFFLWREQCTLSSSRDCSWLSVTGSWKLCLVFTLFLFGFSAKNGWVPSATFLFQVAFKNEMCLVSTGCDCFVPFLPCFYWCASDWKVV